MGQQTIIRGAAEQLGEHTNGQQEVGLAEINVVSAATWSLAVHPKRNASKSPDDWEPATCRSHPFQ
jgi:hypothetical protein